MDMKKIYITEKDFKTLKSFEEILQKFYDSSNIEFFTNLTELKKAIEKEIPKIAIIDSKMKNAMLVAKEIQQMAKNVNIIITAEDDSYALNCLQNNFSGYLIKPITEEKIKYQLENLRYKNIKENLK